MTDLVCPFIGRRCIKDKCMMWIRVNITVDGKPDVVDTCCFPMQIKSQFQVQNELIRTQAGIDKLNNTLAQSSGRLTAIMHKLSIGIRQSEYAEKYQALEGETPASPDRIRGERDPNISRESNTSTQGIF